MAKEQEKKNSDINEFNEEQASKNVAANAEEIIEMAKQQLRGAEATPMFGAENVVDNFRGIPMESLIAAPLVATAEAQQKLTATAWDFYQKVAFEKENQDSTGPKARVVEFDFERPVMKDGQMVMVNQKVKAPFIGLVPIPSLMVDHVDVDFQMEVTDSTVSKDASTATADAQASAKWFVFKADINGKVTTSRENTRTTNQSAKYQVHVSASQQPPTEGLSKLMDIMASCVEPIDSDSSK